MPERFGLPLPDECVRFVKEVIPLYRFSPENFAKNSPKILKRLSELKGNYSRPELCCEIILSEINAGVTEKEKQACDSKKWNDVRFWHDFSNGVRMQTEGIMLLLADSSPKHEPFLADMIFKKLEAEAESGQYKGEFCEEYVLAGAELAKTAYEHIYELAEPLYKTSSEIQEI